MMKLHWNPASPFARKCMVCLHETDQVDDVECITRFGTAVASENMPVAQNPLGKVPALERDDGPTLYDSRVITRFLSDRAAAALYPADRIYETLTLEATADGMMDAGVLMVYEGRVRPAEQQSAEWVEGQWAKIARSLDVLERQWMSHLNGPVDMAQLAIGCALAYVDFRHGARDWRAAHPTLSEWEQNLAARPSMQATMPHDL